MRDHSALCPSYINFDIGFTSFCLLTAASFYKNNNLLILSSCFVVSLLFFDVKSTLDVFMDCLWINMNILKNISKYCGFIFAYFFPTFPVMYPVKLKSWRFLNWYFSSTVGSIFPDALFGKDLIKVRKTNFAQFSSNATTRMHGLRRQSNVTDIITVFLLLTSNNISSLTSLRSTFPFI